MSGSSQSGKAGAPAGPSPGQGAHSITMEQLFSRVLQATEVSQTALSQVIGEGEGLSRGLHDLISATEAADVWRAREAAAYLTPAERAVIPRVARIAISRSFWWLNALDLARLMLEWARRVDPTPISAVPGSSGPGPGEDGYVPGGWSVHARNDPQWANFPPDSTPGFQWLGWQYGHGEPAWSATTSNFMQAFPWGTLTFLPARRFGRYTGLLPLFPFPAGVPYDCWIYDGVGPGTQSPAIARFRAPEEATPDAERIPETLPDIVPPLMPLSRTLPSVRPFGPFTGRLDDPVSSVGPAPAPRPSPAPAPDPVSDPDPWTETVIPPSGGPPYDRGTTHVFKPPPVYRKEVKLKAPLRGLIRHLVNWFTESADAVTAIHKALPPKCRRARTWVGKDGTWHRARVDSMLRDIANCADHLDVNKAIKNLLANVLQDTLIGVVNQRVNHATGPLGGRSGQAYGTRIGHAQDVAGGGDWTQPLVDAFREGLNNFVPDSYASRAEQSRGAPQLAPRKPRFQR